MSYSSEVLADSPLVYWPFDEALGASVAVDASGNGRNLSIPGGSTAPAGGGVAVRPSASSAFYFDGNDRLTLPSATWMQAGSFTFEAWILQLTSSSYRAIISRDGTTSGNRGPTLYAVNGKLSLHVTGDIFGATAFAVSTAHHVAATYDGTTIRLYLDGVIDGSATATVPNMGAHELVVGASHAATAGYNFGFHGRISDVAYYGSALSSARIAAHYAAGISVTAPTITGTLAATLPGPLS